MTHPTKRRRTALATAPTTLHTAVLSVFRAVPARPIASAASRALPRAPSVRFDVSRLVSALVCVSAGGGADALAAFRAALCRGDVATAEAAQALFDGDGVGDVEAIPLLCVIAKLLESGCLRCVEVDMPAFVERAVFEQRRGGGGCQCDGEPAAGLRAVVRAVLAEGRGRLRNSFLTELVSAVFPTSSGGTAGQSGTLQKLALVEPLLEGLQGSGMDNGDRQALLGTWVRQATFPIPERQSDSTLTGSFPVVRGSLRMFPFSLCAMYTMVKCNLFGLTMLEHFR